jgi:hypothetical protein
MDILFVTRYAVVLSVEFLVNENHGLSRTITDSVFTSLSLLSRTVTDCHGLSRTVTDCHGLSRTITRKSRTSVRDIRDVRDLGKA